MSMAQKRINWIDWSKTLCMFLVVLGHCHIQESQLVITRVIYSFHIPLFFFLSGLLCSKSISLSSLKKDLRFLILPYFVYGILTILTSSCLSRNFEFGKQWSQFQELCMGYDPGIGAIWFLPALFICKQLYFFCKWMISKSKLLGCILVFSTPFPAYFITHYGINLPLFSDSSLFGLPFLLLGSFSLSMMERVKSVGFFFLSVPIIMLFAINILLAINNGSVSLVTCTYGNSFIAYYFCALTGITTIVGVSLLLEKFQLRFVTITSYGTIVTLGIHGIILLILQYYIPILFGYYTPTIKLPLAVLYSTVTYIICFVIIIWADYSCPCMMGLKGYKVTRKCCNGRKGQNEDDL